MKILNFIFDNCKIILSVSLILIFSVIYLRTLNFGFINDDFDLVRNSWNEAIDTFLNGVHFRPLWYLSFPLINYFFGPSAFVHHLLNLVLHITNLLLAFYIFKKILNAEKALIIVFFWTLVPQISFQISWVSNRNDLLMTLFLLISLNLALHDKIKSSLLIYILAFLSKVTCLFYPLVYFTKFGLGNSKSVKVISFILFIIVFLISYFALQNGELQSHIAELSIPMRIVNHAKNFVMGWILLIFPIPFFKNIFIIFVNLVFLFTSMYVIMKSFNIEKNSILLIIISFAISIPLSINYEIRTTYTLSLFVIASLISLINIEKLDLIKYSKYFKIIIFTSFTIYGTYTSYFVTNNFKSNQYDINGKEYSKDNFYLNYFYLGFRLFQIDLLNKILK